MGDGLKRGKGLPRLQNISLYESCILSWWAHLRGGLYISIFVVVAVFAIIFFCVALIQKGHG